MKRSAFINPRLLIGLLAVVTAIVLALVGFSMTWKAFAQPEVKQGESDTMHEDPAARVAWERLRLQDNHGRISPEALRRAYDYKKTMPFRAQAWAEFLPKSSRGQPAAVESIWSPIGPGNIGGRTRSILIHPTNPNVIWLGAVAGGVWKTTDGGSSWNTTTDFLPNLAVDCMAIDPVNSSVLYAGTGEAFYPTHGIQGDGIFKTTDGGSTWTQLSSTNNPNFYGVTRLKVSPFSSQTLLATTTTGLFRSTDTGAHWSQVMTGWYDSVVFSSDKRPNSNCLASSHTGLVFYSTDSGSTWLQSSVSGGSITGRAEIAYAPSNPNIVYVSGDTSPTPDEGGLFESTDGGHNFTWTGIKGTLYPYGWYANTVWVDPTNAYVVVVGGPDLFRCISTDGGSTFNKVKIGGSNSSDHGDHHAVINDPGYNGSTNKTVFIGTDGGIYKTSDVLASNVLWTSLDHTLGITQFYGGAANSTGDTIIGGTQDNGTLRYRSQFGAEQWDVMSGTNTNSASDGGFCAWTGSYFYGEYPVLGIYRSSDGTYANLQYAYNNLFDSGNFAAPLVLDPNNSNTLLAGGLNLWRSTNANASSPYDVSWTIIKSQQQGDDNISAIAVAPGNSNIIWVGHNSGNLYRTSTGTRPNPSWVRADVSPLPDRYCARIAFPGGACGQCTKVYVALAGLNYDQGFNADNLWRTTDNGQTWTNISTGLPSVPIYCVVASPLHSGYLYVATDVGVFASADDGAHWSPGVAGDVPANVHVDELFWTNAGTRLVAVTYGRGIFTADTN